MAAKQRKGAIEPVNLIMGFVAILGGVLIIFNRADYGLIMIIIATLVEAIQRLFR